MYNHLPSDLNPLTVWSVPNHEVFPLFAGDHRTDDFDSRLPPDTPTTPEPDYSFEQEEHPGARSPEASIGDDAELPSDIPSPLPPPETSAGDEVELPSDIPSPPPPPPLPPSARWTARLGVIVLFIDAFYVTRFPFVEAGILINISTTLHYSRCQSKQR